MELNVNQIVELTNGSFGYVASFNGKATLLVFKNYTNVLKRYNENLENSNSAYNIEKVYDGSPIEDVSQIFRKSFVPDGLELVWERK